MLNVMEFIIHSATTVIFIKNKTKQKQRLGLRNLLKFIHFGHDRIGLGHLTPEHLLQLLGYFTATGIR